MREQILVILTFQIMCVAIAIIDIQKQTIYNEAVGALFVPAIVSFFVFPEIGFPDRMAGAFWVSGMMLLICLIRPGAFGGGDIKLMVPVGFYLGFERALTAYVLAVFIGGIWGILAALMEWCRWGKMRLKELEIPFAPALCLGSIIACNVGIYW